jgi:lysophospholipase L1-like esterase
MGGAAGKRLKVVGWGDSTTAGTPAFLSPVEAPPNGAGDERSQYAFWLRRAHPDWEVLNKGVNGERSDEVLARFERDVARERADLVVVLAGVNDVYQGLPADIPQRNLSSMYDKTAAMGATAVACTVLPYNSIAGRKAKVRVELNRWVAEESARRSIPFCDTAKAVSDPADSDRLSGSPDGLHPDVEGYRRMAGAISLTIEEFLGTRGWVRDG